ncbi:hypothetical protein ONZ43_g1964 [Nemania bipapillata]|uniref:Uncharacterized protein n=1 Tax=Nemania bipapillata TaxID=110536 RepID=A0ACC2J2T1_9PEZI|nr:hypothetical protein ONZ43_g1964 [Nemania bipapillata]
MLKEPANLKRLRPYGYLDQLLLLAVRRCDEEAVTELLNDGANCNYIDEDDPHKPSILHRAAGLGDANIVKKLIYHGSQVFVTDALGMRPIHWAAERGHHAIVKLLVLPLPDPDQQFGQSPLFMASESVSRPTILVLLRLGSRVHFLDNQQRTPLHVASAIGSTDVVQLLLSQGANAEAQDEELITPLHLAAFGGWIGVVDELLSVGVFADALTTKQQTPLHFVCKSPNPSLAVVLALLQEQANPQAVDLEGMTPLYLAAREGSVAVVELLLRAIPYPHDMDKLLSLPECSKEITEQLLKRKQYRSYRPQPQIKYSEPPYEGNPLVNIVFVHGYFYSPEATWSDGSLQSAWPAKYLPTTEARARVFFWDCLFDLTDFSSLDNVKKLGKRLLDYINLKIYHDPDPESGLGPEPLVIVSHSLGGLVVKAALIEATHNPLLVNTKGIIFLGTPHQGLDSNSMNEAVSRIAQSAIDNRLDPGGVLSSTITGDVRKHRTAKYVGDFNKLESEFINSCQDWRIKVLSFAESASQVRLSTLPHFVVFEEFRS